MPTRAKKTRRERRTAPGWSGVRSFSCADDGRIVAGENGGYRVVCWEASGSIGWQVELAAQPQTQRYMHHVCVRVHGASVVVAATSTDTFRVLDLATGAELARHPAPSDVRNMAFTLDGRHLVVRASTETHVFDSTSFAHIALIDAYANASVLALSPDGRWAAVCSGNLHIIDLKDLVCARSFKLDESPWALSFDAASEALLVCRNTIRVHAARDFALLKEIGTKRNPITTAVAPSPDGRHIATINDRGTATLYAAGTFEIEDELKGHDPSVPDTASRHISEIAFTRAGDLVVSAPPKKELPGITIHHLVYSAT